MESLAGEGRKLKTQATIIKNYKGEPVVLTDNPYFVLEEKPIPCLICSHPLGNWMITASADDCEKDIFEEEIDYPVTIATICTECRTCQEVQVEHTKIISHEVQK